MKQLTYKNILIVLLASGLLSACGKGFLDQTDPNSYTTDKFYKTEKDMDAAVVAAYTALRPQYSNFYAFGDVLTDNTYTSTFQIAGDQYQFDLANVTATSGICNQFWEAAYGTVDRCNTVISRIGDIPMDEEKKQVLIGEVKFIRALTYFNLVQLFGGVPVYTQEILNFEDAFATGRSATEQVYAQIEADLTDAAAVLSETPVPGRAGALAAKGLLGKVYLTEKKYPEAVGKLAEVVGKLNLSGSYAAIFDVNTPYNSEILFAVNYERTTGQGSSFPNNFASANSGTAIVPIGNPDGQNQLEAELMSKFAPGDQRKSLTDSITLSNIKYYYTKKYIDRQMTIAGTSACDWIVLRYADILLLYADALNEASAANTGQALGYVNMVRERADILPLGGLDQNATRLAIENERRVEFFSEGDRWFDLLRRGRTQTVLNAFFTNANINARFDDFELLMPLPFSQIALKPDRMQQNPGY